MSVKRIGFLGFDGVATLDLTGPLEAFATAAKENGDNVAARYELSLVGVTGKGFTSESGVAFRAHSTLKTAPPLHTIVVPGGAGARDDDNARRIADWLRDNAHEPVRVVAVCAGIYPVASSGLLDGRRVTTHWRFTREISRQFSNLRVNPTASFMKDGRFYTSGGGSAPIEMALALIEEDYGSQIALSVARELVMRLRPPGDDESHVDPAQDQSGPTERLADLPAWVSSHLREDLSIDVLAERAGVCPRHFSRLFKKVFNSTPADFIEQLRLSEARRRLLVPRNTVENVASSVGFKSTDAFRRAFERRLGITPSAFRSRFQFKAASAAAARVTGQTVVIPQRKLRAG